MPAAIVIPARMGSTRFPGKVLAPILGVPLIVRVCMRASLSKLATTLIVATDSPEVLLAVTRAGFSAVLTRADHPSGTDRIAEVSSTLPHPIIINVQGDEPLIEPEVIDQTINLLEGDQLADISTVAVRITDPSQVLNPNIVKVALSLAGYALYFSRAPIPYHRDLWESPGSASLTGSALYRHIGIYGYRREALLKIASLPPSPLEECEKLEQLRALEHGMRIRVGITRYESIGVDTPEDLERVIRQCQNSSS